MDSKFKLLYDTANSLSDKKVIYMGYYGKVACALETDKGNIYTGISLVADCGGFCAENAAILEMLKHDETRIIRIVAVCEGEIRPPCGKCCDLIRMMNEKNIEAETLVGMSEVHSIKELLPFPWFRSTKRG